MRNGWNEWAQKFNNPLSAVGRPLRKNELEGVVEDIAIKLDLTKDDRLLDVGCGSGAFLSLLINKVKSVSGVDISNKMIEFARVTVKGGKFFVSQTDNLPFEDNSFDKIICYSVFHYFPDENYAMRTINELLRVCKPGGSIIIGDIPSKKHFEEILTPMKKFLRIIKIRLKQLIRKIKGESVKKGIHEVYYIHKPKNWMFYNLDFLYKSIESQGYPSKVLKQNNNRQWNTITNNYRFDILIEKII